MPTLTPAPSQKDIINERKEERNVPKILPKPTAALLPNSNNNNNTVTNIRPSTTPSIPFPLLILNGVSQQNDKKDSNSTTNNEYNKLKNSSGKLL